jgi:glycosyltransferase involved in cell wall biosynthesis
VLHSLRVGGAEVLAARLARQLQSAYRFVFVCLDELGTLGQELQGEGFPVKVLHRRAGLDWRATVRLGRLLRHERVALVHAHQYTPFFYASAARFLGRRVPILFTEHGRHFPDYPRRKRIVANRFLLGRRDRVVSVGQVVRQALITNEGIPSRRIDVIYNGITLDDAAHQSPGGNRWDAPPELLPEQKRLRAEVGLGPDDLVLIQVARLDYLKDHATAVRTLQGVRDRRPDAKLVLVGEGPERSKIEEEVCSRGLTEHVRFLGLRKDVSRLLAMADVFLLTSISEGIPVTLIEAMSAALPVVSTNVGGVAEVVLDGQSGLLAPSGDDRSLAAHVLTLGEDPALRRHMGEMGRARARTEFAEDRMHAGYQRVYEEMLSA